MLSMADPLIWRLSIDEALGRVSLGLRCCFLLLFFGEENSRKNTEPQDEAVGGSENFNGA